MNTIHEHLVNIPQENTITDVMWKCTSCGARVGFNRLGIGVPFASETEVPDDVDVYLGAVCIPALIYIQKSTFYGQFYDIELVSMMDHKDSEVRALVFRFNQMADNGFPINHPLILRGLESLEQMGILASGRGAAIVAACMP